MYTLSGNWIDPSAQAMTGDMRMCVDKKINLSVPGNEFHSSIPSTMKARGSIEETSHGTENTARGFPTALAQRNRPFTLLEPYMGYSK